MNKGQSINTIDLTLTYMNLLELSTLQTNHVNKLFIDTFNTTNKSKEDNFKKGDAWAYEDNQSCSLKTQV